MDDRGQACADPNPLPIVLVAAIMVVSIDAVGIHASELLQPLAKLLAGTLVSIAAGAAINLVARSYATHWRLVP